MIRSQKVNNKLKLFKEKNVCYLSGEENKEQIKQRCNRLNIQNEKIHVFNETTLEILLPKISNNYDFIIIDSIQTIRSENCEGNAGK